MKSRLMMALLLSTALFLCLPAANASFLTGTTPLTNSQTIFTTLPVPPGTPAGTLLASLTAPYSFTTTAGTTSGTLKSAVYQNPSGTLDFYYQVANAGASATAIARESSTSFGSFLTAVGFRTDGASLPSSIFANGTVAPITSDRNTTGTVIGFQFNPPDTAKIIPGTTSDVLVISTNATSFVAGNAEVIDGGSQIVASFQPSTAVPEPISLLLMGSGLLALAATRRFKKS